MAGAGADKAKAVTARTLKIIFVNVTPSEGALKCTTTDLRLLAVDQETYIIYRRAID